MAENKIEVLGVDHIGIAVRKLEERQEFYMEWLGLSANRHEIEEVPEQKVRVLSIDLGGGVRIELLEPTDDSSPIARFIEKRGEGIHHLALRVRNIRAALNRLKNEGVRLIDEKPRRGAGGNLIAFVHPKSTGGVLLELCEKAED